MTAPVESAPSGERAEVVAAAGASKQGPGSVHRVDLGDIAEDPEFLVLRQNVRDVANICAEVASVSVPMVCTSDQLAAPTGRLRRAHDLLAAQSSSRAGVTASQMAEVFRMETSCAEAQRRWREIARLVELLAAEFAQPRIPELEVLSRPGGAEIQISTVHGSGPPRALRTNGSFVNVPRGRYKYIVRRGGMKPVVGVLDLIDDPRPRLSCILESDASRVDSSCRRGE